MSDQERTTPGEAAPAPRRATAAALAVLAPVVVAIWTLPWFVTQDGPAHVYNAQVLLDLTTRGEASPFARVYEARFRPVPNWAGHLALMGAMTALPPRAADRLLMTATLVLPALALIGLCRRVAGREPGVAVGLAAGVLALNFLWQLGFYSFLLGVAAMLATWSHAWRGWATGRMGVGWVLGLAGWIVVGYVCHPISLGATALGLVVVAGLGWREGRGRRLARTALGLLPLVPLGIVYRSLMAGGGEIQPLWDNARGATWAAAALNQMIWIDPISLARRDRVPWLGWTAGWAGLLAPLIWLGIGLGALVIGRQPARGTPGRAWLALAAVLLAIGLAAPDTLGPRHGNFLGQRVFLAGLLALVPATAMSSRRAGLATVALGLAGALQASTVIEYGQEADRKIGAYMAAGGGVGRESRVAGLVLHSVSPFRANALWHADTLLGVGTGNIVWSNYESAHYYFPVGVKAGVEHPPIEGFEWVSRLDAPQERDERVAWWTAILERHHDQIDGLVVWGRDEAVDAVTRRWYVEVEGEEGAPARVWRRE
jgi:hypothetical protein